MFPKLKPIHQPRSDLKNFLRNSIRFVLRKRYFLWETEMKSFKAKSTCWKGTQVFTFVSPFKVCHVKFLVWANIFSFGENKGWCDCEKLLIYRDYEKVVEARFGFGFVWNQSVIWAHPSSICEYSWVLSACIRRTQTWPIKDVIVQNPELDMNIFCHMSVITPTLSWKERLTVL